MKIRTFLLFLLIFTKANAQQLSIDETLTYLNSKFINNHFKIELKEGGEFEFSEYRPEYQFDSLNYEEMEKKRLSNLNKMLVAYTQKILISAISLRNPGFVGGAFLNQIFCLNNNDGCITTTTFDAAGKIIKNQMGSYLEIPLTSKDANDKFYNALNYLISLASQDKKYKTIDTDPFANTNFKKVFEIISDNSNANKIPLQTENGVYKIWVNIGNVKEQFILDTGASEISLSQNSENELIAKGIIKKEDYLESALFRIADGSIVSCRRVNLKQIKVGNFLINNVTASIGVSKSPLLLGKSFLDKFARWSIDNNSKTLILQN